MKEAYTHITVLLDRTGSMESIRDDTIGGFNSFLKTQKAEPGSATMTLVQFDTQDPYEVLHRFSPIELVPELTRESYVPRAATPLLDALGRCINDLEASLAALKPDNRPSKTIITVVTDGQENSSQEFSKARITKMIREKTEEKEWQFVFLSADLAAFHDATELGMDPDAVILFQKSAKGTASVWDALSNRTSDFRSARKKKMGFDQGDRDGSADKPGKS